MTVTYEDDAFDYQTGSVTAKTITLPAGITTGWYGVVIIKWEANVTLDAPPTGWTQIAYAQGGTSGFYFGIFTKVLTSGDSSTGFEWTWSTSTFCDMGAVILSSGDDFHATDSINDNDYGDDIGFTINTPSSTSGQAGSFVIGVAGDDFGGQPWGVSGSGETLRSISTSDYFALGTQTVGVASADIQFTNNDEDLTYGTVTVIVQDVVTATIQQEGFRFRNDDGSQTAATWKANQDVNITGLPKDDNFRLRYLLNATGDPATNAFKLQYKENGDAAAEWRDVPLS